MSDEALREAQRRFEQSGLLEDEVTWFRERLRAGFDHALLPLRIRRVVDPLGALELKLIVPGPQLNEVWIAFLADHLDRLVEHWDWVVLNCARLKFLGEFGLTELLRLRNTLVERGGALAVCALYGQPLHAVEAVFGPGTDLFRRYPDVEACLTAQGWRASHRIELTPPS